jgi:ATP-binding cassette, subfamily B (MDR/TAP), member 1
MIPARFSQLTWSIAAAALQSWFFAQLMVVFTYTGEKLKSRGNFWSLMFFLLSLGLGIGYFLLAFFSNHLSVVSN